MLCTVDEPAAEEAKVVAGCPDAAPEVDAIVSAVDGLTMGHIAEVICHISGLGCRAKPSKIDSPIPPHPLAGLIGTCVGPRLRLAHITLNLNVINLHITILSIQNLIVGEGNFDVV